MKRGPRAALVQDWFFMPGGSEQVALEIARLLPGSDVFTSFADVATRLQLGDRLRTWPLQRVPGAAARYRSFLPLYPLWFERLNLRDYDLVVSSSPAFSKAVHARKGALHVSYIHTPMRYAWDLDAYLGGSSLSAPSRSAARVLRPWLQRWDRRTAKGPDVLVANSLAVQDRIRRLWGRESEVIHPPVEMSDIKVSDRDDGYLLVVARLLAYRRVDLLVEAATMLGRKLVVAGDGPEAARLRSMAGPTVQFVGRVDRPRVVDLMSRCHAYIVPGEEDFGMAAVEAMAAGKPVVAFRAGGALESVVEHQTGVFFDEAKTDSLADAIQRLDGQAFDPLRIRANAERFASSRFRFRWLDLLARVGVAAPEPR
jgi:glycosyltransferase involved in cell wall biosynthesis